MKQLFLLLLFFFGGGGVNLKNSETRLLRVLIQEKLLGTLGVP